MQFHRCLPGLLLPLLLLGCGTSVKVVPVSGRVTMNQKPLANADVMFTPADGGSNDSANLESAGRTDEQGRYSLKMIQANRDGAATGTYKVRISLIERGATIVNRVPKEYNQNTQLTFTVPDEGTTEANFDVKAPGR
jgi:hypothetical protein